MYTFTFASGQTYVTTLTAKGLLKEIASLKNKGLVSVFSVYTKQAVYTA